MKTVSLDEMKSDYSWKCAFHEAIHDGYGEEDLSCITSVVAAEEGENDGDDWICVVAVDGTGFSKDMKRYCVMRAGCDYTGWDCQAGGKIEWYDTIDECLSPLTLTEDERKRLEIA